MSEDIDKLLEQLNGIYLSNTENALNIGRAITYLRLLQTYLVKHV